MDGAAIEQTFGTWKVAHSRKIHRKASLAPGGDATLEASALEETLRARGT